MSFAEFTYPLLQSWDWWHMYNTKDIQVQVGGADQFGNILAGVDAVNYIRKNLPDPQLRHDGDEMDKNKAILKKPMGFTVPLLTTPAGEKFGKSAGNAIWLDRELTSAFDLYQVMMLPVKLALWICLAHAEAVLSQNGRRRCSSLLETFHL